MTQTLLNTAYIFFVVSYLASAGTEGLSSIFRWRARMLYRGVQALLDDQATHLAQAVYANPLVTPTPGGGDPQRIDTIGFPPSLPSYINPKNFALALFQACELSDTEAFLRRSS